MVNKFLHPQGGAETYTFELGEQLAKNGHEVQYFGMYDPNNVVGNEWGLYAKPVDFHHIGMDVLSYPFRIIWSQDSYDKMSKLIDNFHPDVIHLNNFNYQLTPSIIDAAHDKGVPVVVTAHDSQFVCPNHLLYDFKRNTICTKCVDDGNPRHCVETGCIHGSYAKSLLGTLEGERYKKEPTYTYISKIISPSKFMQDILEHDSRFIGKIVCLPNYNNKIETPTDVVRKNYILYFGRLSAEKGVWNIVEAAKALPNETFICAGVGPADKDMQGIPNLKLVGFKKGKELHKLIREAKLVILPSTCYENSPLAVIEAQQQGCAVLAPSYGGAGEMTLKQRQIGDTTADSLIKALKECLNPEVLEEMRADSKNRIDSYRTLEDYTKEVEKVYQEIISNLKKSKKERRLSCQNKTISTK